MWRLRPPMSRTPVPVESRQFWERKACEYPLPFERGTAERSAIVMDIMTRKGLILEGSSVLDIGCGTGAFTIPFASCGLRVAAVDISEGMVSRLMEVAQLLNINNINPERSGWADFNARANERAFDVVFCGFSAAVESEEDIVKMERCSRRWCVYAASGKTVRDPRCQEMLRELRAPLNLRPDIRIIRRLLEKMGRRPVFETFTKSVEDRRTHEEVIHMLSNRLEAAGRSRPAEQIALKVGCWWEKYFGGSEIIECCGKVEIGVLIWRADEN
jgi:SAM-dependent methyltransferase